MMNINYSDISGQELSELLKNKIIYQDFIKQPLDIIKDKLEEGLKFPSSITYNIDFINKVININDINEFRHLIMMLESNNSFLAVNINERRKKRYIKDFFEETDNDKLLFITIDMFFEDFPYNVIKNIREMISFLKEVNIEVIPQDRLFIYQQILYYENISLVDKVNLFKILSMQENFMNKFYDDVRSCRNLSYTLIRNQLLYGDEIKPLFSKTLSFKYQHNIYELAGQPFYLLVTSTHRSREFRQYSSFTTLAPTSSYSLISDKNISTFLSSEINIILGFNDFNINNVMLVFEGDAYTNHEQGIKIMPPLYTPESLIMKTINYNELLYKNEEYDKDSSSYIRRPLLPNYIICYDKICVGDLSAAKIHNIPIILIHSEYYKRKEGDVRIIGDDDKAFLDRNSKPQDYFSSTSKEKVLSLQ